jgi:signal transduction histidine kinase
MGTRPFLIKRAGERWLRRIGPPRQQGGPGATKGERVASQGEALRRADAELLGATAARDSFLAQLSRELRAPLTSILVMAEFLHERTPAPEPDAQDEMVAQILASGQQLLALIDDMLDLAKLGAGRVALSLQEVPIRTLCDSSLNQLRAVAERKGVTVAASYGSERRCITADPLRLKQVLLNLLLNAVVVSAPGTPVALEVSEDHLAECVLIAISDSGPRIAPEQLALLFQPFEAAAAPVSKEHGGTGLGLALAARLVELHGGSIAVASAPAGNRFTVVLPVQGANEGD